MKTCGAALAILVLLGATAVPVLSQNVEKGQVTVGSHEVPMKAGFLYAIKVEAKEFQPQVTMFPTPLYMNSPDFSKPNVFQTLHYSAKTETNTIIIVPQAFGLKGKGPFNYTFEVTPLPLAAKATLEEKGELKDTDPPFKSVFASRSHHKAFELKLKAGQICVIDMTSPEKAAPRLDSYLYVLDSADKVVRSDDDSGGYPNVRIVFQSPKDETYRIIATGLGTAVGEFNLTVRMVEKK